MRGPPPVVVEDMYVCRRREASSYMYIVHNCLLLVKTKDLKKQKYSQMYSSFEVKIPKQTTEFSLSLKLITQATSTIKSW